MLVHDSTFLSSPVKMRASHYRMSSMPGIQLPQSPLPRSPPRITKSPLTVKRVMHTRSTSMPGLSVEQPEVGGYVWTVYGRASVKDLRSNLVHVELLDWKLANNRRVTCYFQYNAVHVLATKTTRDMNISEHIEYAQALKESASSEHLLKNVGNAVSLFTQAVRVYQRVLRDARHEERADCLIPVVVCCNTAASNCLKLDRYDQALELSKQAMMALDALELKTVDPAAPAVGQVKLFGESRIKALMNMAEALAGLGQKADAKRVLEQAEAVLRSYNELTSKPEFARISKHFAACQKYIKKLRKQL